MLTDVYMNVSSSKQSLEFAKAPVGHAEVRFWDNNKRGNVHPLHSRGKMPQTVLARLVSTLTCAYKHYLV